MQGETRSARWARLNPEKVVAATMRWKARNPERVRAIDRAYRVRNAEKIRERRRSYRAREREAINARAREKAKAHRVHTLAKAAKARAKAAGLPFDDRLFDLHIPVKCPVLGVTLDDGVFDHKSTLDRLVPHEGYTLDNVRIISHRANRLKSDATLEEIDALALYMRANAVGGV